jgi:hypothetical protein
MKGQMLRVEGRLEAGVKVRAAEEMSTCSMGTMVGRKVTKLKQTREINKNMRDGEKKM